MRWSEWCVVGVVLVGLAAGAVGGEAAFKPGEGWVQQGRGNSGVYLRGRKEVQVLDSYGKKKLGQGDCGGLYGKAAPTANACKPPGEWNAFDITIVGHKITVKLNGTLIQDGIEVPGITGGSMGGKPDTPGPIMLQGNHTTVWYRNIWVKPIPREGTK